MGWFQRKSPLEKEWAALEKKELAMARASVRSSRPVWREKLEELIPRKVFDGLDSAFCKGFQVVFEKGVGVIEKTYNPERIRQTHAVADYAVQVTGRRKEIRQVRKNARSAQYGNLAITTAEGLGLGALGVGLPDIVMFIAMLLKGIYETALHYGFEYDTPQEQLLILKMMETSLAKGAQWLELDEEVDELMEQEFLFDVSDVQEQIRVTGRAFALDMLLLKFIQGLPVVGIFGGAGNPVYYNKVLSYVQLKYRKRYLMELRRREEEGYELDEDDHEDVLEEDWQR